MKQPAAFDSPEAVRRDLAEARAFFAERPELWMTPAFTLLLHAERLIERDGAYERVLRRNADRRRERYQSDPAWRARVQARLRERRRRAAA